MTTLNPHIQLSALVIARPELVRILEKFGLDYCCGGSQTLNAACQEANLDVEEVLHQLLEEPQLESVEEWTILGPIALTDHLEMQHHSYLKEALPRLSMLAQKVSSAHNMRHPELDDVARTLSELRNELEPHLLKEERILFPMIRQLFSSKEHPEFHCGNLRNPISVMLSEHDRAGELLLELRTLTSEYAVPGDGCASFRAFYEGLAELEADTHLHIHKENNLLFPAVLLEEA